MPPYSAADSAMEAVSTAAQPTPANRSIPDSLSLQVHWSNRGLLAATGDIDSMQGELQSTCP